MTQKTIAFAYSLFCFLAFNFIFLYFIGFIGNFGVSYSIDKGDSPSLAIAILINGLLILLFGIQHSVMARPRFKQSWTTVIPEPLERSTYVLFSCNVMMLLCSEIKTMMNVKPLLNKILKLSHINKRI